MNFPSSPRWLHRFAWLTATLTLLLPVTTGAVVTTLKAGMVFSDWPSSDGYNMLAYPWLSSTRDQFVEHGHRLSGLTIGVLSLGLAIFAKLSDCGTIARWLAVAVFASVFLQGMLGGARVLLDRDTLAMIHGEFAAGVFCLMSAFVLVTSTFWQSIKVQQPTTTDVVLLRLSVFTLGLLIAQYLLGGVLRHLRLGWAWWLHPWFSLAPVVASFALFLVSRRRKHIARITNFLLIMMVSQAFVGLCTWSVRYGLPNWGVIATQESMVQVVICSLHKILGMLTLMTSVLIMIIIRASFDWNSRTAANFGQSEVDAKTVGVAL